MPKILAELHYEIKYVRIDLMTKYWLMKSEPTTYSIEHLKKDKRSRWEGVRNYQARNFMRDQMKVGDLALFYHSNASPSGVAGICRISKEAIPDSFAWDPKSNYFDPKSTPDNPRWWMVEVEFVEAFDEVIPLKELKEMKELDGLPLLQKGQRLSIMPITKEHFNFIKILTSHKLPEQCEKG